MAFTAKTEQFNVSFQVIIVDSDMKCNTRHYDILIAKNVNELITTKYHRICVAITFYIRSAI